MVYFGVKTDYILVAHSEPTETLRYFYAQGHSSARADKSLLAVSGRYPPACPT